MSLKKRIEQNSGQYLLPPAENRFALYCFKIWANNFEQIVEYRIAAFENAKRVATLRIASRDGDLVTYRQTDGREVVLSTRGKWPKPGQTVNLYEINI